MSMQLSARLRHLMHLNLNFAPSLGSTLYSLLDGMVADFNVCYNNPFEDLSDDKFVKLYRLTKPMTEGLVDLVEPFIEAPTRVSDLTNIQL